MVNDQEARFSPVVSDVAKAKKNFENIINNPRKFNCLNDNIDHDSETIQEIHELYSEFHEKMFPEMSPFEYKNKKINEYLDIEHYNIQRLENEKIKNTGKQSEEEIKNTGSQSDEEIKSIVLVDHNIAKQSTEEITNIISDKNTESQGIGQLINIRVKSFYSGIVEIRIAFVLTMIVLVIMCTFIIRSRAVQALRPQEIIHAS